MTRSLSALLGSELGSRFSDSLEERIGYSYDGTPLRPLLTMIVAGEDVRARLPEIQVPTLIITSRQDHVVNPEDSDVLAAAISGPVERIWLEKSFHVATLDYDRAEVESATVAFAQRVTAG